MKYICPECGGEIPEDSEFCYTCGRKKDNTIRLDQSGHFVPPEKNKCSSCGAEMLPDDQFCPDCGMKVSKTQITVFRPKMVKYGWIGVLLAFVPGALGFLPWTFSIFGLGHLYFRRWTRGLMFLMMTAFMFYVKYFGGEMPFYTDLIFKICMAFIYLLQGMEVFVLAFMPPKKAR